jgi:glycine/D-amino acid oxidase-like deaminating enzyme
MTASFRGWPKGSPAYSTFPVVPESETDSWFYGAITEFIDPAGCADGDGYVIAPDGSRAGLVWDVGTGEPCEISPPDKERWGVYQVWFPQPIRSIDDLVSNFRAVLPQLKQIHARVHSDPAPQA